MSLGSAFLASTAWSNGLLASICDEPRLKKRMTTPRLGRLCSGPGRGDVLVAGYFPLEASSRRRSSRTAREPSSASNRLRRPMPASGSAGTAVAPVPADSSDQLLLPLAGPWTWVATSESVPTGPVRFGGTNTRLSTTSRDARAPVPPASRVTDDAHSEYGHGDHATAHPAAGGEGGPACASLSILGPGDAGIAGEIFARRPAQRLGRGTAAAAE